jgi:hypothetical protein
VTGELGDETAEGGGLVVLGEADGMVLLAAIGGVLLRLRVVGLAEVGG